MKLPLPLYQRNFSYSPLALTRRDVDLTKRTIHAAGTKTKARDRYVHLFDFAHEVVAPYVKALPPDLNAPLFPDITAERARTVHYAACEALGLQDYRIHDARHTLAVWLLENGVMADDVAAVLGHTDTKMVLTVYGRVKSTTERRAMVFGSVERKAAHEAKIAGARQ